MSQTYHSIQQDNSAFEESQGSKKLIFLLLGYMATSLVGAAQIYFLVTAMLAMEEASGLANWQIVAFSFFFFFFSTLFLTRYVVLLLFAFMEASKKPNLKKLKTLGDTSVTILLPAYNEEANIEATINSALAVSFKNKEVIVIDDGSTDNTLHIMQRLKRELLDSDDLKVIHKSNGGKSSALNLGYQHAKGDYILSMDADSELAPDAIERMLVRIHDTDLGGCAGQVSIKNTNNLMSYIQSLEYTLMNGTGRLFQSFFSSVLIGPGPITLFKREALDAVADMSARQETQSMSEASIFGPWESDTFAEDAKLSMAMLTTGYGIVFEPSAFCYTQCPSSPKRLLSQRYRWVRGNLQACGKVWDLWSHESDKKPSMGAWLIWFLVEAVLWPIIDMLSIFVLVIMLLHSDGASAAYLWYFVLLLADMSAAAFCAVSCRQPLSILVFVPIYRLFYGVFLEINALFCMYDESRNAKMRWN